MARRGKGRSDQGFVTDNTAYESWLRTQCAVVDEDLDLKHELMAKKPFGFLRATYFRWAKTIEHVCPDLKGAPHALCIGDIHMENFGTWRDIEGRWVWGVNDFDEGAEMPYAFDLVRLATSIRLAPKMQLSGRAIEASLLDGYHEGLDCPRATLLDEAQLWMRPYVACSDEERQAFWDEVFGYPTKGPPSKVKTGLTHSLPKGAKVIRYCTRVGGMGSLGRPRYVAIAEYGGGHIVREAKAVVASAWTWAHGRPGRASAFAKLTDGAHRSPDPFLAVHDGFVFRRIAADTRKIELGKAHDLCSADIVRAMGFDLASVHAADRRTRALHADIRARPAGWLRSASKAAQEAVEANFKEWQSHVTRS
jgi:hypothetical protein